jgi:hypothetical protein
LQYMSRGGSMILVEGWYEPNFKHFCWSWAENSYESNNPSIF